MALNLINIGTYSNDGTGDPARVAFAKTNSMFTELYGGLVVLPSYTVATLPVTVPTGAKAYATDALAPSFGAAAVGGGTVFIPVFFNGATWICG